VIGGLDGYGWRDCPIVELSVGNPEKNRHATNDLIITFFYTSPPPVHSSADPAPVGAGFGETWNYERMCQRIRDEDARELRGHEQG